MARRGYENDFYYHESNRPIPVEGGLKARSRRGSFAKNWWAERWIEALERLVDSGRLSRGRGYARKGQVRSIEETRTGIAARVQGSRPAPYKIQITLAPLSDGQWERVIDQLAEQAIFSAQLLAGEMPAEIEQAFRAAGVSLFPASSGDLVTDCSCPDYANPCKHVAAAHYILAERFDQDPFLLFRLRGRTQDQILAGLRVRRAGQAEEPLQEEENPETILPLEDCLDNFWDLRAPMEGLAVNLRPPAVETPLLKRLGPAVFVPEPGLESLLLPAYRAFGASVLQTAFKEESRTGED